jgi:hypothetical protein
MRDRRGERRGGCRAEKRGEGGVRTDDESPAKSCSTQVKTLIEDIRPALHGTQNCRISL